MQAHAGRAKQLVWRGTCQKKAILIFLNHRKDRDKEERLRYLYVGAGDIFAQEQMGAIIDDSVRPFLPAYVYQLQSREPFRDPVPPDCVYITVDPASGGKCDFYIFGFYMRNNVLVVRFCCSSSYLSTISCTASRYLLRVHPS